MVKVIEHGKCYGNPPPEFWWIGRKMKCEKCDCIFELEQKDKPQLRTSCPECGSIETIEQKSSKDSSDEPSDDTYLPV